MLPRLLRCPTLFLILVVLSAGAAPACDQGQPVPETYFGLHVNQLAHWPSIPFKAIRPANVSWRAVNPKPGKYDWDLLDEWVRAAERANVQLNYLFLATPKWASSRPDEPCYAGPIGCAAPPARWADWEAFVTAVVRRYRGRIHSYELWNEPNDANFWTGTPQQMVEMARRAYRIIKRIDPAAVVVSPAPTYSKSGPPHPWLEAYLAAGGGQFADVIGLHAYTGGKGAESSIDLLKAVNRVLAARGQSHKELWITEGGWGRNRHRSEADQSAFLVQQYLLLWSQGARRFYWYQWDNPGWGTLWSKDTGVRQPGRAYQRIHSWMAGACLKSCERGEGGLWSCRLERGGSQFLIVWNPSTAGRVAPGPAYVRYQSLLGSGGSLPPGGIVVGNEPVLLERAPQHAQEAGP